MDTQPTARYQAPLAAPYQPPQLPDYKPRGMSTLNTVLAWLLAFIVVIFLLSTAHQLIDHRLGVISPAKPTATVTPTPHPTTTIKVKVKAKR